MELREALQDCSTGLLVRIAREHKLALPEPPVRDQLVEAIESRFALPGYLESRLADLSPLHRRLLGFVAAAGGEVRGFELERRLRQWLRSSLPAETSEMVSNPPPTPDTGQPTPEQRPLLDLLDQGLLFRTFVPTGLQRGEVYCLPAQLLPLVGADSPARLGPEPPEPAEGVEPELRCDPAFDLLALASYLRRSAGERAGQVHDEAGETVHQVGGLNLRDRWRFLLVLARESAWLDRAGSRLLPNDAVLEVLEHRDRAPARLWEVYLACDEWNDLVESGLASSPLLGRLRDPSEWRLQLLDVLQRLDPERWYPVDAVVDFVRRLVPDLVREHYESPSASLLEPRSGTVLQGAESWMLVEAPLLRYLLAGPFYWLGIVRWSTDSAGRELLGLTEPGRDVVTGVSSPLFVPLQPAALERDGTLRFPAGGDLAAMYRLEPYLRLISRADPSEYRLETASFCDGLAAGGNLEQALALLSEVCGGSLTERARQTLSAWAEDYGRLSIAPAVLFTIGEEELGRKLLDDPALEPFVLSRLGPAAARTTTNRVEPLVAALRKMGYYPKVDATVRLMASRGAYAAVMDERALEWLFVSLEALRRLAPTTLSDLEDAAELRHRLQTALGSERTRRLQALARKLIRETTRQAREAGSDRPARKPRR